MPSKPLFRAMAVLTQARLNCLAKVEQATGNDSYAITQRDHYADMVTRHESSLRKLMDDHLPHGAGIDGQCTLDYHKSTGDRLVIGTAFHHMNDGGMYDGWTHHDVIVTPSLTSDFDLRITGRNRNDIKDYLHEVFHTALTQTVES